MLWIENQDKGSRREQDTYYGQPPLKPVLWLGREGEVYWGKDGTSQSRNYAGGQIYNFSRRGGNGNDRVKDEEREKRVVEKEDKK